MDDRRMCEERENRAAWMDIRWGAYLNWGALALAAARKKRLSTKEKERRLITPKKYSAQMPFGEEHFS